MLFYEMSITFVKAPSLLKGYRRMCMEENVSHHVESLDLHRQIKMKDRLQKKHYLELYFVRFQR